MGLKSLSEKVTSKLGRQILIAQKHSPSVLYGLGVLGVGTTVLLACRATLKLDEVLNKTEEELEVVEVSVKHDGEEAKKASFNLRMRTAIDIAKLYAPAVAVGIVTIGAMTGSHVILRKRNAGLAAAYAIVDKSFKQYRGRVISELGPEQDFKFRFGTDQKEVVDETENGPVVTVVQGPDQAKLKKKHESMYARIFDEWNPLWSEVPNANQYLIQSVENHANQKLRVHGYVTLNDVYDMLGFDRTKAGQLVGWVKNPKPDEHGVTGDGFVDFGVWNAGTFEALEWISGNKKGILLDFNVDGVILDLLPEV
jgi:hypothetical protein